MNMLLIAIAVVLAIGRVFSGSIPEGLAFESFKDACHLYVGGLFGVGMFGTWLKRLGLWVGQEPKKLVRLCWWLAWGLTGVEVVCFVWSRFL